MTFLVFLFFLKSLSLSAMNQNKSAKCFTPIQIINIKSVDQQFFRKQVGNNVTLIDSRNQKFIFKYKIPDIQNLTVFVCYKEYFLNESDFCVAYYFCKNMEKYNKKSMS